MFVYLTLELQEHYYSIIDRVLNVRRLDTGEEGTLLISHYCKWPAGMLKEATWIEGCYTPYSYENDPRLLLGYHPYTKTTFKRDRRYLVMMAEVDKETSISLTRELNAEMLTFINPNAEDNFIPRQALLTKLWRQCIKYRTLHAALVSYYAAIYDLVDTKKLSAKAASLAWMIVDKETEEFIPSNFIWLKNEYCNLYDKYADALVVKKWDDEFKPAESIAKPLFEETENGLKVLDEAWFNPTSGFIPAVSLKDKFKQAYIACMPYQFFLAEGGIIYGKRVEENVYHLGYAIACPIH